MRVLLVTQEYPPETRWGGIGTYAGILAPALAAAGAEVHVLSVVRGQDRRTTAAHGVQVHRAPVIAPPGVGRLSGHPETWRRLTIAANVAREQRRLEHDLGVTFDVAECPEWNAEGLLLGRRRALPVVVRMHSAASQVFPFLGPIGPDERRAIRIEDDAISRATLVTGTHAQIAYVRARLGLPDAQLREITLPVQPVQALPLPSGAPVICFAGRFEHRKAPETLVRALPAVRAELPDVRLVLVGRDCARPGIASSVTWLANLASDLGVGAAIEIIDGWSTSGGVARAIASATVCAAPSRWESFGYVAAEAAALGRPIAASALPGFSDIVVDHETGRLVPLDDIAAWSETLVQMLRDRERCAAMGAAAAARVATECAPDRVAMLTLAAYEAAIARFAGRRVEAEVA
jgi:glycosyltransferase involved in cell wall biosynthesis